MSFEEANLWERMSLLAPMRYSKAFCRKERWRLLQVDETFSWNLGNLCP